MRYTDAILSHCNGLATYPLVGIQPDDTRPGLRVTHYNKGRTIIASTGTSECISIIGVFYGGQDYETILQFDTDDDT